MMQIPPACVTNPSPLPLFQKYSKEGGFNFAARTILQTEPLDSLKEIAKTALPKDKRLFLFEEIVEEKIRTHVLIADLAPTIFSSNYFREQCHADFTPIPTSNAKGVELYGDWCDGKKEFSSYSDWIALYHFAETMGDWSVANAFLQTLREDPCLDDTDTCEKNLLGFISNSRIGVKVASQLTNYCIEVVCRLKRDRLLNSPWKRHESLRNLVNILAKAPHLHFTSNEIQVLTELFPNTTSLIIPNSYSLKTHDKVSALHPIRNLSALTHLEIDNCSCIDSTILEKITQITSLTTLILSKPSFSGKSLFLLQNLPNLRRLGLRGFSNFGPKTTSALASLKSIKTLDLSHSTLSSFYFFKKMTSITTLLLIGNLDLNKKALLKLLQMENLNYLNVSFCPKINKGDIPQSEQIQIVVNNCGKDSRGITSYHCWYHKKSLPSDLEDISYAVRISAFLQNPAAEEYFEGFFFDAFEKSQISIKDNERFFQDIIKKPKIATNLASWCLKRFRNRYDKESIKTQNDLSKLEQRADESDKALFVYIRLLNALECIEINYPAPHLFPSEPQTTALICLLFPNHFIKRLTPHLPSDLELSTEELALETNDRLKNHPYNGNKRFLRRLEKFNLKNAEDYEEFLSLAKEAPHLQSVELGSNGTYIFNLSGIEDLRSIESLELLYFQLDRGSFKKIASLTNLKRLALIDSVMYPEELDELKTLNLKELNLSINRHLTVENLEFLRGNPTLAKLHLNYCLNLDDSLLELIKTIPRLKMVEVYGCCKISESTTDWIRDLQI